MFNDLAEHNSVEPAAEVWQCLGKGVLFEVNVVMHRRSEFLCRNLGGCRPRQTGSLKLDTGYDLRVKPGHGRNADVEDARRWAANKCRNGGESPNLIQEAYAMEFAYLSVDAASAIRVRTSSESTGAVERNESLVRCRTSCLSLVPIDYVREPEKRIP